MSQFESISGIERHPSIELSDLEYLERVRSMCRKENMENKKIIDLILSPPPEEEKVKPKLKKGKKSAK